jgi:hypothetical protein
MTAEREDRTIGCGSDGWPANLIRNWLRLIWAGFDFRTYTNYGP